MLRLDLTTKILQLIATETCGVVVTGSSKSATGYTGFSQETAATASTQTICAAPAASTVTDIDHISLRATGGANTITFQLYNSSGTVTTQLFKAVLSTDDTVEYTHGQGWKVLDANGVLKVLSADVVTIAGPQTITGNKTFSGATALGTPASGVMTNVTGTASGLTAGNSSQLLGGTWAVPGTIGSTTPNSGAFTTLSLSNTLTFATSVLVMQAANTLLASDGSTAVLYSGSTAFVINDQADTKNLVKVNNNAPNNALVVSSTGLAAAGNLSATGTAINFVTSGAVLTVGVGADNGTVSAGVFTDRTKYFNGDALAEIDLIAGVDGEIDHSTLPAFVQVELVKPIHEDQEVIKPVYEYQEVTLTKDVEGKSVKYVETQRVQVGEETVIEKVKVGEETVVERDLGAMISMLTVAIRQLNAKLVTAQAELEVLKKAAVK